MRVAILMSTFNGEKYLEEQLLSISKQTIIDDITLYIRDDGSRDETFNIIEKWSKKIDIKLYREENVGPAKSFWILLNKEEIVADYYLFCDQDDIWDVDKVEKSIARIEGNINASICNCRIIDSENKIIEDKRVKHDLEIQLPNLFVAGVAQGCALTFNDKLRQFIKNNIPKTILMHDLVVLMYALLIGEVVWIDEPLFGYRVHENNVVSKKNKSFRAIIKTVKWNWKNSSKNSMEDFARDLLIIENIPDDIKPFLFRMSKYKKSLKSKLYLSNLTKKMKINNKNAIRSYKIRLWLNLL